MSDQPIAAVRRGLVRWYFRVMETIAALLMLVVVVVMAVQVFFRYGLNASLIWAEELCRYLLIWISFLFVGVAFHRGELVAVDFVTRLLSPSWKLALKAAVTVPALLFLWLVVTNGYVFAARFRAQTLPAIDFLWSSVTGAGAGISVFWVYVSVAVGCALLMIHMVADLAIEAADLYRRKTDHHAG